MLKITTLTHFSNSNSLIGKFKKKKKKKDKKMLKMSVSLSKFYMIYRNGLKLITIRDRRFDC